MPAKKKVVKKQKVRDIGVDVEPPTRYCRDPHCPFHGRLTVKGQMIEGIVRSASMDRSVVVVREYLHYVPKYERYEKRRSSYSAHAPECLDISVGERVVIMECRPLSKTVSFVVIGRR
ncbi:MAG TPA: 30S ribosomal protein S17 [Thermoplasmata archaeon]|nr:30S ribosomal protein S17 [Thermoplasmata archaeon]